MTAGNRLRYKNGVLAIYTVPDVGVADDAPLATPLSYLSRIKFHSGLAYPKVIQTVTTTLSLPGVSGTPLRTASYSLFAHGRSGQPWVLGRAIVQGIAVAFTGSVPVQQFATGHPYARFLALGADATNVWIHEYCPMAGDAGTGIWNSLAGIDVPLEVYVTDEILE